MISASTKRVPRPVRGRRAAWVRADGGHTKSPGAQWIDLLGASQSTVSFMRRALPPNARMRAPMRKACVVCERRRYDRKKYKSDKTSHRRRNAFGACGRP